MIDKTRKLRKLLWEKYENFKMYYNYIIKPQNSFGIPFISRLKMNLQGFTADQYIRYNLKVNDINSYISELERWKSRRVNGRYNLVADDKLIFTEIFEKHVNVPRNFAWIKNNIIYKLNGGIFKKKEVLNLLSKKGRLIIKPAYGSGGGRGVYLIEEKNKNIYLNGTEISKVKLFDELKRSEDYIITEYIDQHDYSKKIFDKSVNTIRVVTTINTENGRATVLRAVHRIGKNSTIPVDNADKGALISKINIDTGIMGKAKTFYSTDLFCMHPDTGEQIEGIKIPHWDEVKRKVTNVAEKFPYIYFIAWDIVVTEESFMVIEINASSGLNIFQMWQGERNTELGNFYRKHNIIK